MRFLHSTLPNTDGDDSWVITKAFFDICTVAKGVPASRLNGGW